MRYSLFFCLLSLCSLIFVNTAKANHFYNELEIILSVSDEPFEYPQGPGKGHRSIPIKVPFSAFLNDDHSIDLDFYKPVGEIDIIISQDGTIVYISSENIESSKAISIQSLQGLSGDFLLEIKADNGAYAYGRFTIN